MAKHPEDIILRIVKDIQSTLANHSKRFDRVDERLNGIDSQLGDLHDGMVASFGLASHANVRNDSVKKEIEELRRRVKRLEAKR